MLKFDPEDPGAGGHVVWGSAAGGVIQVRGIQDGRQSSLWNTDGGGEGGAKESHGPMETKCDVRTERTRCSDPPR